MALVISRSSSAQKPWMLKDFLLDDLGSCSSTGFRSFPRRNCCAALRSRSSASRSLLNTSSKPSSSASAKISHAIQRASVAVISAVKLLPFKSPALEKPKKKKSLLPRSLSRRLLKKSLWKKADDRSRDREIERWISSAAAAAEKYQPSDLSNETSTITFTSASTTCSTSWSESDSEFTLSYPSLDQNGVVEEERSSSAESKIRGEESIEEATTEKNWSNEGEKEQLSPVSVLKFPDDHNEETGSFSPLTRRLNHLEGNKEKLMHKLWRFECLSRLDLISLEVRLSLGADSEDESSKLSFQSSPSPLHSTSIALIEEEEMEEEAVERLLKEEGLVRGTGKSRELVEEELLIEAEDWLSGRCHDEVSVAWKLEEKRKVNVEQMEEGGVWRSTGVEREEVALQVESEVLACLVDEVVREFCLF